MKTKIQTALENFLHGDFTANALDFWQTLGYNTEFQQPLSQKTYTGFASEFTPLNETTALVSEWIYVDQLFFLTPENTTLAALPIDNVNIDAYLIFGIELKQPHYSRGDLVKITREFNRVFPRPVLILFKHSDTLTLSVINRRIHKRDDSRDVLEKVTLIKDIRLEKPHRAHLAILEELAFSNLKPKPTNFVELHNAWQGVLNTKTLNKQFYKELSQWYFWAMKEVYFPDAKQIEAVKGSVFEDANKVREHNAKNLIRLLTRLLFVWFIKEKQLIPDELFNENWIKAQLNGFQPNSQEGFKAQGNDSHYYRAILQNLFFATLNQTRGERKFRNDGQNRNVTTLMRYHSYFNDSAAFLTLVESVVPFMNGGLFDCLDKPIADITGKQGGDVIAYEDGFSDRPDNRLKVPDYIFFGTHTQIDLSAELGNKNKSVEIKGLIDLLKSYKFTLTENTPIEEDIALDPELLGQVFENLLASYNPETKTTARKQTGSFYTPREIVDYMVDESLLAYFESALRSRSEFIHENDLKSGSEFIHENNAIDSRINSLPQLLSEHLPVRGEHLSVRGEPVEPHPSTGSGRTDTTPSPQTADLRQLLSYNETQNPFDDTQTTRLIQAIDSLKILDPACGSGAFPMGILHKLVHCLHKLDPKNARWKARQIEKINAIDDADFRDKTLQALEDAFENEVDYGRKLFLIENCIYGVDIQAIAIQISKLRFFISLIVDQKSDKSKPNFGVLPLPNLETKFVAANTLIGIDKPKAQTSLFDSRDIEALENQLKNVRHRLFSAKTPATKRKLREQDKALREQIGDLLQQHGWGNATAQQLAQWNPYDQNANADFFDVEWMFGLSCGFDIVIGNPPYIFTRDADFSNEFKDSIAKTYFSVLTKGIKSKASQSGKINLFALFILKGIFESKKDGVVTYIVPNNLLRTTSYDLIRRYLLEETSIDEIVDLGSGIFSNVTASTVIFRLINNKNANQKVKVITDIENIERHEFKSSLIEQNSFLTNVSYTFNIFSDGAVGDLINKISSDKTHLGHFCIDIIEGIVAHKHLISELESENSLPLIEGKTIKKYGLNPVIKFIDWDKKKIHRTRPDYVWNAEKKIIIQRISGGSNPLTGTIDTEKYRTFASVNNLLLKADYENQYEFFLALINSRLLNWFYANSFSNNSNLTVNISKTFLEKLPIPKIPESEQQPFIELVDKILADKKAGNDTRALEREIDGLVYGLYGLSDEEILIVEGKG